MPSLTPAVRIAATSILLLSVVHIVFWVMLAITMQSEAPNEFPYTYFAPLCGVIASAGFSGVAVGTGILYAKRWARIAALALAALVAFFCAFAILVSAAVIFGPLAAGLGVEIPISSKSDLVRLALVYLFIFSLSIWWIFLFSRKRVAEQFYTSAVSVSPAGPKKSACPPPIALLAWLMIVSSALSALSWPLILGRIPAMLFTHIFYAPTSNWIWAINLILFLACGIGLLGLQRWSYTATIALHIFWLVSLLVTQLSPLYENYMRICFDALELPQNYPGLNLLHFPQWPSALATALPTAILIAGLFYYRRGFLKAAAESSGHKAA
jgi:hypothetical protein